MPLESAIILSILSGLIPLILGRFKYLIDKKRTLVVVKVLILIFILSFGFLMGMVGILYFWVGFTGENTLIIALISYALLLMLIPVKTHHSDK